MSPWHIWTLKLASRERQSCLAIKWIKEIVKATSKILYYEYAIRCNTFQNSMKTVYYLCIILLLNFLSCLQELLTVQWLCTRQLKQMFDHFLIIPVLLVMRFCQWATRKMFKLQSLPVCVNSFIPNLQSQRIDALSCCSVKISIVLN